jgi:hypothetical protein
MPLGNVLQALIMLAVVLVGSVLVGNLFRRIKQPAVVGVIAFVRLPPNGGHQDSGMNGPAGRMSPCPEPAGLSRPSTRSRPPIG